MVRPLYLVHFDIFCHQTSYTICKNYRTFTFPFWSPIKLTNLVTKMFASFSTSTMTSPCSGTSVVLRGDCLGKVEDFKNSGDCELE